MLVLRVIWHFTSSSRMIYSIIELDVSNDILVVETSIQFVVLYNRLTVFNFVQYRVEQGLVRKIQKFWNLKIQEVLCGQRRKI